MPGQDAAIAAGAALSATETGEGRQAVLILGSASPRRRNLLAQIGVVPTAVLPADIDETPARAELPRAYARRMAAEKCVVVAAAVAVSDAPEGTPHVLTADTVVSVGRRILGKPADASEAAQFLMLLSGRRHRVTTAVCLRHGSHTASRTVETHVKVKRLSDEEISAYLRSGEWQGKAGGYAIQGLFGAFIPEIIGSYTNVVGLPLTETAALLTGTGLRVPYESAS